MCYNVYEPQNTKYVTAFSLHSVILRLEDHPGKKSRSPVETNLSRLAPNLLTYPAVWAQALLGYDSNCFLKFVHPGYFFFQFDRVMPGFK